MGGGDLNLKKSWHPSTMKNMEKVWKAEQQNVQEKKRIAELKREIEMEKDREDMKKYAMETGVIEKKDDKKLDWMYKGPNQEVNREEYLLGKPIDKTFEKRQQEEKDAEQHRPNKNHVEYECIPPSLRSFSGTEQVDLARKLQEDPLYVIKKKEMESRSQLLKNPVKLKQLREMLDRQSKKSKEKKRKKSRKKKSKEDSSDEIDRKLDSLLAAKYKKLKNKITQEDLIKSVSKKRKKERRSQKGKGRRRSRSSLSSSSSSSSSDSSSDTSSSSSSSSEEDSESEEEEKLVKKKNKKREKVKEKKGKEEKRENGKSSKDSKNFDSKDKKAKKRKMERRDSESIESKREERSGDRGDRDQGDNSHHFPEKYSRDERRFPKPYGLIRADGTEINTTSSRTSSTSRQQDSGDKNSHRRKEDTGSRKNTPATIPARKREKLSEEEKERRRREMMANASWRDKERERNVKKYREEERSEQSDKSYSKDFIRNHLARAAETGTVESRIRANMNNIQRSGRAMDANFAKR